LFVRTNHLPQKTLSRHPMTRARLKV
jgi:hypothetical protein